MMWMNNVNKTLYIPLYGKAYVSKKGIILNDPTAVEIWNKEGFSLKGKSKSKWLAYYMAMRSRVIDDFVNEQIEKNPEAVVLHLGCGLDSRCLRLKSQPKAFYDIDFKDVIDTRKLYFSENNHYHMISSDVSNTSYLSQIPQNQGIIVMEGLSMYLNFKQLQGLFEALNQHFSSCVIIMDVYSTLAAKASKFKNPINDVGVSEVYGIDDSNCLNTGTLTFKEKLEMTPNVYISLLDKSEQLLFRKLYAGNFSKKLYQLFVYNKGNKS